MHNSALSENKPTTPDSTPQMKLAPDLPTFSIALDHPPTELHVDCLAGFVWQAATQTTPLDAEMIELTAMMVGTPPDGLPALVTDALRAASYQGKHGETLRIFTGWKQIPQLLLVGLGKREAASHEQLRRSGGKAGHQLRELGVKSAALFIPKLNAQSSSPTHIEPASLVEGAVLGCYRFSCYQRTDAAVDKTDAKPHTPLEQVWIGGVTPEDRARVDQSLIRGKAICLSRDLGNHPPNVLTPAKMAAIAQQIAAEHQLQCTVLEQAEIEKLGMGLFLGVARGSALPPKLVILDYCPQNPKGTLAFVGKGITFDTGGISLKPSASMEEMKFDMSGAGAVFGAMTAIAQLHPTCRVIGITPLCENMPDGKAIKPGDILNSHAGKTVEVLNTDAEGRLILADALSYAVKTYQPQGIVDLATLTGACVVALGHYASGAIGNDDRFTEHVVNAGNRAGDVIWPLPNFPEYEKSLKSKYADLQNIGGRDAGAITGGLFLKPFVSDTPWVHLDIAGTAWGVKEIGHAPKQGATGVGVALLIELAMHWNAVQE